MTWRKSVLWPCHRSSLLQACLTSLCRVFSSHWQAGPLDHLLNYVVRKKFCAELEAGRVHDRRTKRPYVSRARGACRVAVQAEAASENLIKLGRFFYCGILWQVEFAEWLHPQEQECPQHASMSAVCKSRKTDHCIQSLLGIVLLGL